MTLDLDELERIVSVATPGPWRVEGLIKRGGMISKIISHGMNERGDGPAGYVGDTYGVADAEFVAALNPTVCLALIARARDAERLEDKVDGLTADVARLEAAAEGSVPVGGALSLLAEKDAKIASLTAELTAARAEVERLRGAVKPILAARDAFDLSDRNQASAYYTLVDRPDGAWKALRAALTPAEEVEG